jgi:cardiolipin synthase A/B
MRRTHSLFRLRRWHWAVVLAVGSVAVLAGLAACNTLPKIVPDLARDTRPPVQLESARGPLTAAQSKAVLDGLRSRGQDTSIFDRHLAL